jgi:hypothetical protein
MVTTKSKSLLCFALLLIVTGFALAGCGGGGGTGATDPGGIIFPANVPNVHQPDEWIALIEAAGFQEYADLARELLTQRKIRFVRPPTLMSNYNAYAFVPERMIWINEPLFERYPDIVQQAAIFLHEMVHVSSGELSHVGPWWKTTDDFEAYWQSHPLP